MTTRVVGKLTFRLLGAPEVLHGGRPARFRARKALALLAYLAAEGGMRSRADITALLWPRSAGDRGRAALRSALSGLRRTLEAEPHHYLRTGGGTLGLAFGPDLGLDLQVLQAAYSAARSNPRADDLGDEARVELLAKLRAGAEAYRGDFLEGFSLEDTPEFDLWVEVEREVWRGRAGLVYDHLCKLLLEGGEARDAIATAARWVEHAPASEGAHRRLMEAQFAAGDRSGALNTYEALRSVLTRELGTEPGTETEALISLARDGGRAAARPVVPPVPRPEEPKQELPGTPPFVGRAEEFGVLLEDYHDTLRGDARAVAFVGDAGIGKTRLAEEFLLWARERGAEVLSGRTYEVGGRLPYGVVVDTLRPRLERERSPDDLLEDVWLSELSRVLPELRERYPDLPLPAGDDEAEARTRLFEAITRLVMALAERSPVVLFLDDMHWASKASLDVIRYAGRRWAEEGARVLLVLGLRAEATEALPSPAGWVAELGRTLPARRLMLDPLAAADTLDLVRALTGTRTGEHVPDDLERFGRWLFEETGGHPLFLAETIKVLLERGVLAARPGAESGGWEISLTPKAREPAVLAGVLPESVREAIGAQLSRLSPAASNLLAAGAVLGGGTFEQLVRVAGMEEGEGLSALDEALASRLLREVDAPGDEVYFAFSHDKVRDVAYTEAGAARRRVFHRRALEMLEEEAAPATSLARHALAAKEHESAFGHLLAAGDAAMAVFATEDALGYYEQARGLLGGPGRPGGSRAPPQARELEHLHVNLGRARELAGEWEEAQGVYEEMLSRAREAREPRLEWAALNRLAILAAQRRFDVGRAKALIQESLRAAEAGGDRAMLAETEWNLAQMAALRWEPEVALSHGERALGLARKAGLEELEARSLFVLGQAHRFAGRWEECVAYAARAAAHYEALGGSPPDAGTLAAQFIWAGAPPSKELANRAMEALSLTLLAIGKLNLGLPREVVEAARRALRIGQEIDNDWAQTNAMVLLGYGLWDAGEYGEALLVARRGLEMSRKVRHPAATYMLTVLGTASGEMLGLEEAQAMLLEALAGAGAKLPRPWSTTAISQLCANRALAGDWEAAHRYALEAMATRNAAPAGLIGFDFERHLETEALLREGDEDLAREAARRLGERVGNNRRFRLVHLRMLAVLDRWDGDTEGTLAHLREAEVLAEEMGLPGDLWQIRAALGELYKGTGDEERADEALAGAAETVVGLADGIGDETLREAYLGAPKVRALLGR